MAIFEDMSTLEKQELIVSLAALICADAKVEINKENLDKLVSAAGCKVESYWTAVFGSAFEGKDLLEILAAPGVGAAAPAAAAASADAAAPAAEEKKEEEEEEEEDVDMSGGGLFGGDDDDW